MREKKPPSLKDVAALAGVSSATVSRLLNGTLDLPQETKTRIDEAIRSLDYRPNPHARRLSRGRSDTIGLVVPDIANPFFATFVAAVEQEADRHGLAVSLHATLNRTEREVAYLDLIARNHLDGLIFVTNHPDDGTLAARISRSGKVVVVDEDVPGAQAPKIFCDNVQGGLLVGRHLATFGHRRVLFLGGPPEMISARRRAEGLRRGLDPEAEITVWHGDYTIEFGRAAAQRFLAERRRERAIFATSDEIVIGLMEVFRERGVSVPHDVSIVGFDDVGPLHLFAPAMTAVRQPVSALGTRAVECLLETDWTVPADLHQAELMPIELVERDSVAPPAD